MTQQKAHYEALLEKVTETLKNSPQELKKFIETTELYGKAASDMTKDELSLIEAYLKSDLKTFSEEVKNSPEPFKESPFYQLVSETVWRHLAEITDKTQLEWIEVMDDIKHKGVYRAGELVGLGHLVCEKCGYQQTITHVTRIEPCIKCGCKEFNRQPLEP